MTKSTATVGGPNLPTFADLKKDEVLDAIQTVHSGDRLSGLYLFSVCPIPFIRHESYKLLEVYKACGGTSRIQTPDQYYGLPALYAHACQIIDSELAAIKKEREENG